MVCPYIFGIVSGKGRWLKFIQTNERKYDIDESGPWLSWLIGSDILARFW